MTRITLGEFKNAARDRMAVRGAPTGGARPTPFPVASKALRIYHSEGEDVARSYIRDSFARSPYWGPGGPAPARGWARAVATCFDNYLQMASGDSRPSIGTIAADVQLGRHDVGVSIDVVLLDAAGYVGRWVLWDKPVPTPTELRLLAAPVCLALEEELGGDRVAAVEIWHLRSGSRATVSYADGIAALGEATRVVARFLGS